MKNACELRVENDEIIFDAQDNNLGKLLPKDGKEYRVLITEDNPDIVSLRTERRLTEQACFELEKQMGYNIKIRHELYSTWENGSEDVTIEFTNSSQYFQENTLAYAGYPFGSLRGKVVFNNKFAWLDGYQRYGFELRELGIILPNMEDDLSYRTYNYRQTVKHELCGHVFGLPHTQDPTDVMFAYYHKDRLMFGQESKETLNSKYGHSGIVKRALPDFYIKRVMIRRF